eukprot:4786934-Pleurochrysis_carterae.AAC.1
MGCPRCRRHTDDTLFADDDTGSETGLKFIPENVILSHLSEQPLFGLGSAQSSRCASKFSANGIEMFSYKTIMGLAECSVLRQLSQLQLLLSFHDHQICRVGIILYGAY